MRRWISFALVLGMSLAVLPLRADVGLSNKSSANRSARPVTPKASKTAPRVYTPSVYRHRRSSGAPFPWKRDIPATIFWIGERPSARNPTPNHKSSWDTRWMVNYGGYDHPDPSMRIPEGYRPKGFLPQQNPFYVALPYNDVDRSGTKPEARRVIPWFKERFERNGKTVLKGQWVVMRFKDRFCFAQWEDCGPFVTDDWSYVFGRARPKNRANKGAGIDVSPAVRDYLRLKSGDAVDWRFAKSSEVRNGPWKYFGTNNQFAKNRVPPKPSLDDLYERRAQSQRSFRR